MSAPKSRENWLAQEVVAGRVDTVALSFADRLGGWRGKRVPAREFVERGSAVLGFCDGMIVCDIQCGVIEKTPFTNYSTGYPDLHVTLDCRDARPMGWRPREAFVFGVPSDHLGVALPVAPAAVLASVIHRLGERGVAVTAAAELSGAFFDCEHVPTRAILADGTRNLPWLLLDALVDSWIPVAYCSPGFDPGSFVVGFDAMSPHELAQAVIVAKGAAKELARADGLDAIFMTRRPDAVEPALLRLEVTLGSSSLVNPERVAGLLCEARPLLFPSVNAMRQRVEAPESTLTDQGVRWSVSASAEADPSTALATFIAAVGAAMEGIEPSDLRIDDLANSPRMLDCDWLVNWLGTTFLENAVPLFEHEASLFAAAVTDWEVDRYWGTA